MLSTRAGEVQVPLPRPLCPACSCRPPLPGTQEAWLPPPASLAAPPSLSGCPHPPLAFFFHFFQAHTHCSDPSAAAFGTREELSTTRLQGAAGLKGTAQPSPPQSSPVLPLQLGLCRAHTVQGSAHCARLLGLGIWRVSLHRVPSGVLLSPAWCPPPLQQGLGPSVYGCCGLTGS